MKRVVVRVYAGDAKTKGNPLAESTGFLGSALAVPGSSNVDWTTGSTAGTPGTTTGPNGTTVGPNGTTVGPNGTTVGTSTGTTPGIVPPPVVPQPTTNP
jgi:hypothetical protein